VAEFFSHHAIEGRLQSPRREHAENALQVDATAVYLGGKRLTDDTTPDCLANGIRDPGRRPVDREGVFFSRIERGIGAHCFCLEEVRSLLGIIGKSLVPWPARDDAGTIVPRFHGSSVGVLHIRETLEVLDVCNVLLTVYDRIPART